MKKETLIRVKSKVSGTPRPELGALTLGAEYDIPEALFDDEVFDLVDQETDKKQKKGAK